MECVAALAEETRALADAMHVFMPIYLRFVLSLTRVPHKATH